MVENSLSLRCCLNDPGKSKSQGIGGPAMVVHVCPALGKLRQGDREFEFSQDETLRPVSKYHKNKETKPKPNNNN
jgi:hypothetical protein